jgi:hypothetical protein
VVAVCRDFVIMGQSSPPQRPDVADFGLQFASASRGDPKSATPTDKATSLKSLFMTPRPSYSPSNPDDCDLRHA